MKTMNALVNGPAMTATMRALGEEMAKVIPFGSAKEAHSHYCTSVIVLHFAFTQAGIIEDVISDAMAAAEPDGLEEEADEEVQKVMYELTSGLLGKAPAAPTGALAGATRAPASGAAASAGRVAVGAEHSGAGSGDLS
jgi:hypothetical protein